MKLTIQLLAEKQRLDFHHRKAFHSDMERTLSLIRQDSRRADQHLHLSRPIKFRQWIHTISRRWIINRETFQIQCTMLCSQVNHKWVSVRILLWMFEKQNKWLKNILARIYDVPTESKEPELASAIIAPSSITHRTSPQLQIRRPRELDPTTVDTGKDTQSLVEEDKSECWSSSRLTHVRC